MNKVEEFRQKLQELPREELLAIIKEQDEDSYDEIMRIEEVFATKLEHLTWQDGSPINERPLTNEELSYIVDPPFMLDPKLTKMGLTNEQQMEVHIAQDRVLWAKHFLGVRPRVYQVLVLRHPGLRKVMRWGRRLGKTYSMAIILLHYAYTNNYGRCLVMAPMKSQVKLIYDEVIKLAQASPVVNETIKRNVTAPQYEIELTNRSTIRFFTTGMKSGGKCLTPDHDVLTIDGWKSIADVTKGETVLTWSDGRSKWEPILETHEYDFNGDLVTHEGKQVSFRVTPNHKFAAKTRAPNSQWRDVYAEDLKDYFLPTTGTNPDAGAGTHFSNEELELWGWWLAEGSGFIGKMARISQVKQVGRERIIELAQKIGLRHLVYEREIRIEWEPPIYSGTNAYNKYIPRELMDHDNIHALLIGLLAGDGWMRKNGGWEYSSSSFQLANDVQELAIRLGMRANLREKVIRYIPVDGSVANRHWVVSAYPYKQAIINPDLLKRESYEGKVHCITVDSGYFLTRHNGLIHITGNSDNVRGQEAHVIILDEMDYMGPEDTVALLAMLQNTDTEKHTDKMLIAASTPTGRREKFYDWCVKSSRFKEFWFPSYCNPGWTDEDELEYREEYTEMQYRHEIEADWGEDAEGVYPRKWVDRAFIGGPTEGNPEFTDWKYHPRRLSAKSQYLMGVDWDKYGAGPNIVVLEICGKDHEDERFQEKLRVVYRKEIPRSEFVLTEMVDHIIELNHWFNPEHIYVDRGSGEVQVELLHQYGLEHPETGLRKKVKGVSFSETIEVRDPATKRMEKKHIKPFMVENLRWLLEKEQIIFPASDEELYMQITSYVVVRVNESGRPVFEASGTQQDHAHDALILACLAYKQHYDDLMKSRVARFGMVFPSGVIDPVDEDDMPTRERIGRRLGSKEAVPVRRKRALVQRPQRSYVPLERKKWW